MKLHYKGKYNLDPETLPAALHKEGAVQFKEAGSTRELGKQANIIAVVLLITLFIPIVLLRSIDLDGFGFWIGILLSLICTVKGAKTYMSGFHSWWYMPEENGK